MFAASKTASVSGGYQISRSLRFNSADSAYLNRTPASAGNRRTFTVSAWVKRAALGTSQYLWEGGSPDGQTTRLLCRFNTDDTLRVATGSTIVFNTTQVFRDPSSWYHIVVAIDTPNATQASRARLYVNGSEVTTFSSASYFGQNDDTGWNMAQAHSIGRSHVDSAGYLSAYITEFYNVDGSQLTPSSFGQTDAQTGVWQPKAYSGSYGTNGFYLNFSDNSNTTAATLGKDYSGNGNNWTPNNFSVTAGAGNDSLVDSPTSYGVDTGVGGTVRGNYCTLNPLAKASQMTLSNGNLDCIADGSWRSTLSTFGMTTGKWYWEQSIVSGVNMFSGIAKGNMDTSSFIGYLDANGWGYYNSNGYKWNGGSGTAYGASVAAGDIVGIAFDADAGTLVFYKNGVSQGTAFSGLTSGPYFPAASSETQTVSINFGQRPFAYTAPSGYKALCTQNLPTPTIGATSTTLATKYFNPVLYTGNGGTQSVTGVGFQPDFTWVKSRTSLNGNGFEDAVRGAGQTLESNNTSAEVGYSAYFTAFTSDGFNMALGGGFFNSNGQNYVAWNWKANGSGSTNTAGTVTSTVSANTTSGFSVVTWTGNGTAGATVGHGLGVAPSMIIVKSRNAVDNWPVYHISLGNTQGVMLNKTDATSTTNLWWNNTSPTSTVFSTSTYTNVSARTYVTYCFAAVAGYSAFGSYTGNGSSDGAFIYTGFRPAFVLIKFATGLTNWLILDDKRDTYNVERNKLYPNVSDAEDTSAENAIDFVSNGFKIRTGNNKTNDPGATMIYAAFASAPLKFSLAR